MNELIAINLHDENLEFVKDNFSECWVVVRRICENIGLASHRQIDRIKNDERFNWQLMLSVAEDGKNREMFCLAYEDFWGWLFSINPKRVKKQTAEKLNKYYKQMKHSIHDIVMSRFSLTPGQQTYHMMLQRDKYMLLADEKEKQIQEISTDVKYGELNKWGKPRVLSQKHTLKAYPVTEEEKESFYKKLIDNNNNLQLQGE